MAFEGRIEDFQEYGESRETLLERARALKWYHTVKLDESYTTPGIFDLDDYIPCYMMPESLEGLRCLDIGAGSGYWSFEMERRRPASVLATDLEDYCNTDFSIIHGQEPICSGPAGPGDFGLNFRLAALLRKSRVEYMLKNCYDLRNEDMGTFDFVWCGSMLMHLQGPMLALRRMSEVCGNTFIASTEVDISLDGGDFLAYRGHEIPFVHFLPSPSCFVNMLSACGYEKVLRGPTFDLRYRDRRKHKGFVRHTTCVALKNASDPAIAVPAPRRYEESEMVCAFEALEVPKEVAAGREFHLLLMLENTSGVDIRTDGDRCPVTMGIAAHPASRLRKLFGASGMKVRAQLPDWLPAGLKSVVRVTGVAPARTGTFYFEPTLFQSSKAFRSNGLSVGIKIR